ncbi:MAG: energy-converting hydrogenase B subunit G, EhbG [Methanosphaera sp.]|nr:energy-converting hydrogenase B subunit G, EhbG [Methanosphaera sp.]
MNMYEKFVAKLKSTFGADPEETLVSGAQTSSVIAAELVLIASLLIAASTIRLVSPALMIVVEVALIIIFLYVTPIMPKLYKEFNDDLNNMMFYAVLALAIIAIIFYWGVF